MVSGFVPGEGGGHPLGPNRLAALQRHLRLSSFAPKMDSLHAPDGAWPANAHGPITSPPAPAPASGS
jgi:hypothetical protein